MRLLLEREKIASVNRAGFAVAPGVTRWKYTLPRRAARREGPWGRLASGH